MAVTVRCPQLAQVNASRPSGVASGVEASRMLTWFAGSSTFGGVLDCW